MFSNLILTCGILIFSSAVGMAIADKIEDYKRKKNLKKALDKPVMVKVRIVDNDKTTIDYIDNEEDFKKLVQKHLTR
jgi:hypothetical protein